MDVSDLISVIDDHGFEDIGTTRKVAMINEVVWDICALEPWPFLEKSVTFTFDGSSGVPTNYPTNVDVVTSIVDTGVPRRLYPIRWENWRESVSATADTSGDPVYYYFLADQLSVFPVPASTNTTTTMAYLAVQAELNSASTESDILLPAQYHSVIWHGVLRDLYAMEDDDIWSAWHEAKFDKQMLKMRDRLHQRQLDRPDTIEIVDPEDIDYLFR